MKSVNTQYKLAVANEGEPGTVPATCDSQYVYLVCRERTGSTVQYSIP